MGKKLNSTAAFIVFLFVGGGHAQTRPVPAATPDATVRSASSLAQDLAAFGTREATREQREQAYAKLLEGQRYIFTAGRLKAQGGVAGASRSARQSFQRAVELDPRLAEAYTALAELALSTPPGDLDEAVGLATLAIKLQPNNFGSHRILARLYTYQSKINTDTPDKKYFAEAIQEWKEVTRLDPRNAEAWAFLSAIYEKAGKSAERIEALRKWVAAAVPIDTSFYRNFMGRDADLSPESASLQLASALVGAGQTREAVETLSLIIADDPDNYSALDLLRQAIENANGETAALAVEALQQAIYANPKNISLVTLLARVQAKAGKIDEAIKLLNGQAEQLIRIDRPGAAALKVALGDLLNSEGRATDALKAYEDSLKARGLDNATVLSEDEREFAVQVFSKMIDTLKAANRLDEVGVVINRARKLFGDNDLFADRQLIAFYREQGNRAAALAAVKAARTRAASDYGLLRMEATLLTENGKVDEAVALVKKLIGGAAASSAPITSDNGSTVSITVPRYDDFSNYLFISQLYTQAGRGADAAAAANQAYAAAQGAERKQIARLTLATAMQRAGNFQSAETTLREILRESPGNPIALNNLGYFLLERGTALEEALDLIKKAVAIDPTNPSYLDSLGWAYFRLGNLVEAENNLKLAAQFDPASATIQEHLGDAYEKAGKKDFATAAWKRALSLAFDPEVLQRLKKKLESIR